MSPIPHKTVEQIVQHIQSDNTIIFADLLMGGASAQVILLDIKNADGETRKCLLRIHSEIDRERNFNIANYESRLLKTLHVINLPVAQPYYLDESCSIYPIPRTLA